MTLTPPGVDGPFSQHNDDDDDDDEAILTRSTPSPSRHQPSPSLPYHPQPPALAILVSILTPACTYWCANQDFLFFLFSLPVSCQQPPAYQHPCSSPKPNYSHSNGTSSPCSSQAFPNLLATQTFLSPSYLHSNGTSTPCPPKVFLNLFATANVL